MSRSEPVDARVRLAIFQWPDDAPRGSVATFCVEHGISRKTFDAIWKRAREKPLHLSPVARAEHTHDALG